MNSLTVRLSDICDIGSGGTPDRSVAAYFGGDVPWVKSGELREETIYQTDEHLTQAGVKNSSAKVVPAGALLIAMYGATVGRMAILGIPAATNQAVCFLIPDPKRINRDYLYHWMRAQVHVLLRQRVGGAQPNINQGVIRSMRPPLPSLADQERISAILDRAEAIRRKRRTILDLGPELLYSAFLKTFGDPVSNPRSWPIRKVEWLLASNRPGTRCGPFGSALKKGEYQSHGIPVWGIDNVLPDSFVEEPSLFISESKFEALQSYAVENGDILISRAGTVGRMCVARPRAERSIIGTNLIRVSLDSTKMMPEYFTMLLTLFGSHVTRLKANAKENAYSFLNTGALKELEIPVPDIETQKSFFVWVERVRRVQARTEMARSETERLFQSLVQCAFSSGQVFAKAAHSDL